MKKYRNINNGNIFELPYNEKEFKKTNKILQELFNLTILNNPEWVEVSEPSFQIIQVKRNKTTFTFDSEGVCIKRGDSLTPSGTWTLDEFLNEPDTKIYKVKRLSDDKFFTVGDDAKSVSSRHNTNHTITSFKISQKSITRDVKDGIDRIWVNWEKDCGGNWLDNITEGNDFLFVSEDGVKIKVYDNSYGVDSNFKYQGIYAWSNKDHFDPNSSLIRGVKYFSTEEIALKYITLNKPKLVCLNDLLSVWGRTDEYDVYEKSPLFQNFKKLFENK